MPINEWTQFRQFPFADLGTFPDLAAAWRYSADRQAAVRRCVQKLSSPVACIAVSGSLNRMEAHTGSDLDLLVVVDDRTAETTAAQRQELFLSIWQQLQASPDLPLLKAAKPGGVFSTCASWKDMTDLSTRGIVDADILTFGQRMQLLLDAQPVAGDAAFAELRQDLLNWYSETRIGELFEEAGRFHWLWQDVQRYWRSLRSRSCWLYEEAPRQALEVNLKLRSSRLVLIAAFLQAISVAHTQSEQDDSCSQEVLQQQLLLSPLERIKDGLANNEQSERLIHAYQMIWKYVAQLPDEAHELPEDVRDTVHRLRTCLESLSGTDRDWLF